MPTSTIKQNEVQPPSEKVTHVYTRQHNTKGLQPRWAGPFKILSRPSRSTLKIKVGLTSQGEERVELRAWADVKPAYLRDDAEEAQRPKRGRPTKILLPENANDVSNNKQTASSEEPVSPNLESQPFHGFMPPDVSTVDFSVPPPNYAGNLNAWQATAEDLRQINQSISSHRSL